MSEDAKPLPTYQRHEIVQADKVVDIQRYIWMEGGAKLILERGNEITVDRAWLNLNRPAIGGYYLISDGIDSFLPANDFNRKYKEVG